MSPVYWTVMIRFKDGTSKEVKQRVYDMYQTLADDCGGKDAGILSWMVDYNVDTRKGYELVEFALFRDEAALEAFRAHKNHGKLTDFLRQHADWVIGRLDIDPSSKAPFAL